MGTRPFRSKGDSVGTYAKDAQGNGHRGREDRPDHRRACRERERAQGAARRVQGGRWQGGRLQEGAGRTQGQGRRRGRVRGKVQGQVQGARRLQGRGRWGKGSNREARPVPTAARVGGRRPQAHRHRSQGLRPRGRDRQGRRYRGRGQADRGHQGRLGRLHRNYDRQGCRRGPRPQGRGRQGHQRNEHRRVHEVQGGAERLRGFYVEHHPYTQHHRQRGAGRSAHQRRHGQPRPPRLLLRVRRGSGRHHHRPQARHLRGQGVHYRGRGAGRHGGQGPRQDGQAARRDVRRHVQGADDGHRRLLRAVPRPRDAGLRRQDRRLPARAREGRHEPRRPHQGRHRRGGHHRRPQVPRGRQGALHGAPLRLRLPGRGRPAQHRGVHQCLRRRRQRHRPQGGVAWPQVRPRLLLRPERSEDDRRDGELHAVHRVPQERLRARDPPARDAAWRAQGLLHLLRRLRPARRAGLRPEDQDRYRLHRHAMRRQDPQPRARRSHHR